MQSTDRRAILWGAALAVFVTSASALADSVVDPDAARRLRAEAAAEVTYVGDHGHVAVFDVAGDLDRNPDGSLNREPGSAKIGTNDNG